MTHGILALRRTPLGLIGSSKFSLLLHPVPGVALENDFLKDYLSLLKYNRHNLSDVPHSEGADILSEMQLHSQLRYSNETRSVVVPTAFTAPRLLYNRSTMPECFNYGTLGALLAKETSEVSLDCNCPPLSDEIDIYPLFLLTC